MVTGEDKIRILLSEPEIKDQLQKTILFFDDIKRNNLRIRHPNIQFDCFIRGYIGEYAIKKWLSENKIIADTTIRLMQNNIDIDLLYKYKNIEIKASLVPDNDIFIENAIMWRDIKIIKRTENINDLAADIYLQLYFQQKSKAKDMWLKQQSIDISCKDINYLYNSFRLDLYKDNLYFVAWMDKETLKTNINKLPDEQKVWTFGERQFWKCRIKNSNKPIDLIHYLNKIK